MLAIPKRPLIIQLATKGFAVFIIGFVGSMGILNYLHPGKSTSTDSSVVTPGAMNISAKTTASNPHANGTNSTSASTSPSGGAAGNSAQWQANLPNPSWATAPSIAPAASGSHPATTTSPSPSVATSPVVQPSSAPSPSNSAGSTAIAPTPAPAPAPTPTTSSGTSGGLLPTVNLQGSTGVNVPLSTNALPLN